MAGGSIKFDDGNKLVPLRGGLDSESAGLLRALLEGHGIKVFAANENVGQLRIYGGVDLWVNAADKADAEALLANVSAMPTAAFRARVDADGEELACSQCGSHHVHGFVGEVPTWMPGIRLHAEAGGGWYHCMQCGSYYRNRRGRFSGWPIALGWALVAGAFTLCLIWVIEFLKML